MRLLIILLIALTLYSCDNANEGPSTPPIPPTPIVALGQLTPQTTAISGELGQYLKIVDKAYEIEGNNKEWSLTITVEAIKPTGPLYSGMCASMQITMLNDKEMPISEIEPVGLFDGNNELRNILTSGSGQAFIRFHDYLNNADSLIKKSASSLFMISGKPLFPEKSSVAEESGSNEPKVMESSSDESSSSSEATSSSSANEDVKELADKYCDWSDKEADAKDRNDYNTRRSAHDNAFEVRRKAKKLSSSDFSKFKELTKDCKGHH